MTAPIKQSSFAGGEIAPSMYGRTDLVKYETGLRQCRNMTILKHGGATGRPGTMYVGTAQNGGNQVRLIPFIFNETGLGQSYVLEFGNLYVGFYQNGGVVVSGGNPYTIVSPYLQADLQNLKFQESADVVTIVHPNYPPYELRRVSATNWTLTQIVFGPNIGTPTGVGVAGLAGTTPLTYFVTAFNAAGEESEPGEQTTLNLTVPVTSAPGTAVTITWAVVTGAVKYNVYSVLNGAIGYIGTGGDGLATSFIDYGYTPDFTNSPAIINMPFTGAGNYPSVVGYVQQRRGFASTINNPVGFWLSQPGLYANFNTHVIPDDSDAVIATVAGEEVNSIQAIIELKFMLLLTAGAELYVQGNGTGVVTASGINASVQSQYGCSTLRPLKVADVLLFNQALGSFIRDFSFDFSIDGYRGNDITIFSSHLFEGFTLSDWAFQKIPDSIVWAVRSDGILLACTYVREQQMLAWTRHDFNGGIVENVCAIPENGQYAVYLSIQRTIGGVTTRYIERMSSRIWSDPINATYLDCFSTFDGRNTGSTTMTLTATTTFTTGNTAYQQQLTLTASASFFTAGMVGDEIFLSDAEFENTEGSFGNQVRCIIQAYTSPTVVTVTPNKQVPGDLKLVPITTWAHAVKTVSGLGFLVGESVSVWADRFVVGSPLNNHVQKEYSVPLSGTITLDKCYSVIYVGLPMTQDVETLDMETSAGETILSKRKRQAKLAAYFYNTRSVFAGSENPDTNKNNTTDDPLFQMNELKRGGSRDNYDQPPQLVTDQDYIHEVTRWNKNGRIFLRNVDPVPFSVLAVVPAGDSPAPSPFYEKV